MKSTTEDVKKLREMTGAGMLDAKRALEEAKDIEDAVAILRKKGHASLAKKSERSTKEGIISSYIHAGGKVGVLVELNCETDFVARNEEFKELSLEIALHIAASSPICVSKDEVPADKIESEKAIYMDQVKDKPENIREQIVSGKLEKYYESVVLLEQPYVRDPDKKVKDLIAEKVGKLGENIQVRRFAKFILGAE
ncbi:MAG: elongation factor Ts [Candidatus Doudnabacteria bacterium]|nr:elongation factor Ts [Candidatus Doudnabacteria bacterium]